jgi:hypothetical protein
MLVATCQERVAELDERAVGSQSCGLQLGVASGKVCVHLCGNLKGAVNQSVVDDFLGLEDICSVMSVM